MGLTTATERLTMRRANREDMPLVADFVRSSADWYREIVSEDDMAEHEVDAEWQARNYEKRDFYIGCAGGDPVGTISLQFFGDSAYLGYIYLDVEHVGKGFGHQLMRFAEVEARKRGMKNLALIAHPEATWATKAYERYGFEVEETEPERVKAWKGGVLEPYFEDGFELYLYDLESNDPPEHAPKREVTHA